MEKIAASGKKHLSIVHPKLLISVGKKIRSRVRWLRILFHFIGQPTQSWWEIAYS
jgi:hypothetical protein